MIEALRLLREEYGFRGYIHAKAIPGPTPPPPGGWACWPTACPSTSSCPARRAWAAWRPTRPSRHPGPMAQIRDGIQASRGAGQVPPRPRFAPAGQSTQMIIGATPESDRHILTLTQALYDKYKLKRVFYSAYMPVSDSALLPPAGLPAAPAAGAPALPGGLAAAVLPLPGRGAAGRGPSQLQSPGRP